LDSDAEAMADALWLSHWFGGSLTPVNPVRADPEPETKDERRKESGTPFEQAPAQEQNKLPTEPPQSSVAKPPEDTRLFTGGAGLGAKRASAIRVPAASALPDSLRLARALRPFNRRRLSTQRFELDEEATAEAIAQFGLVRPVLQPIAEPWFNIALVVDGALSM